MAPPHSAFALLRAEEESAMLKADAHEDARLLLTYAGSTHALRHR